MSNAGSRSLSSSARSKYLGLVVETNQCGVCNVVEYHSRDKIIVRFDDGTDVMTTVSQICRGAIKNPNHPSVYGVGFIGQGIFTNKNSPKAHQKWSAMLERCYCEKYQSKKPTYRGCIVDERWLNFQTFARWFNKQRCEDGWHLDKDLLVKGNSVYGPDTCVIVPREINMLTIDGVKPSEFKRLAEKYKDVISVDLYKSLVSWS